MRLECGAARLAVDNSIHRPVYCLRNSGLLGSGSTRLGLSQISTAEDHGSTLRWGSASVRPMATPGRPGIRGIAKQFGVSPMTVQNVARARGSALRENYGPRLRVIARGTTRPAPHPDL